MAEALYDPFDPQVLRDPFPAYRKLREQAPVSETPAGFWAVSRYDDVLQVLRSPAVFSSAAMSFEASRPEGSPEGGRMLISADPPLHTKLRNLVNRAFTSRRVAEMEPHVAALVDGLLAPALRKGSLEFVEGFASPLPTMVIAEMLGIDPERRRDFKRWSDDIVALAGGASADRDLAEAQASLPELNGYLERVIAERRRAPRPDLLSALIQATEGGEGLTPDDVRAFGVLLLIAGNETTTNLLSNALLALLDRPELLERLRREPKLVPALVEETLRWDSPVQAVFRAATRDVELGGATIPEGCALLALLGSANRDERRFPDPDRFDVGRDPAGHVAFGFGIHFCVGAPLARLEARVALERLLPRLDRLHLEGEPERLSSFFLRGLTKLPLAFEPA